jgi:hypothetical protein
MYHPTEAQHTLSAAGIVQISHALITILECVHLGSHDTHPHGNLTHPRLGVACPWHAMHRYPIPKFLDGHGPWWHVNAVFNKPPKKEIARCKIRWTGWPREKVITICSTTDPALWKGELRPVVECNRKWYSVGVTTSLPTCPEMSCQSQLLRWIKMGRAFSRGTPHRKRWFVEDLRWCSICACGCSVPQIRTLWLITLPPMWNVASLEEDQSFYKTIFLHFRLHFLVIFTPFHFVCWC